MPEFDPATLSNWQRRLGPAGFKRVIDSLVADAPRQAQLLRDGAAQGDVAAVQRAAHSIKTLSGMFGALELQRWCQELEDLAAGGKSDGLRERAEVIAQRFERLAAELRDQDRSST